MRVPSYRVFLPILCAALMAATILHCDFVSAKEPFDLSRFPALDKLTLPSSIRNISWLTKSRITYLDVSGTQITNLKVLPPRLKALRARTLFLGKVDLSGTNLTALDLLKTRVGGKIILPPRLEALSLNGDILRKLPALPKNLRKLILLEGHLSNLTVPRGIQNLTLKAPLDASWETTLPATLTSLSVENDSLEALPPLPSSVENLLLTRTDSLEEPLRVKAPARIKTLRLHGAKAENWKDFADSLTRLELLANSYPEELLPKLQTLELISFEGKPLYVNRWPPALNQLSLKNFPTVSLPPFPKSIEALGLSGTDIGQPQVKDLLNGNETIETLSLENWHRVDLAQIPQNIKSLNLSGVQYIDNLGKWPKRLKELICERCRHRDLLKSLPATLIKLDIDDSRGITEIPEYPNLKLLSARDSDVLEVADSTLAHLTELDVCGSSVNNLASISSHLKMLTLTQEQLKSVLRLPEIEILVIRDRSDCADAVYSTW